MTLIKDVMLSRDWGRQKVCWPLQSSFAPKVNNFNLADQVVFVLNRTDIETQLLFFRVPP